MTSQTDARLSIGDKPDVGSSPAEAGLEIGAELAVLFPDQDVVVRDPDGGEPVTVTVREFRFLEGLRASPVARPLIEALATSGTAETTDAAPISDVLSDHAEVWLALLARATGRDAVWLARLRDRDAQEISAAMWTANAPFFIRRAAEIARREDMDAVWHSVRSSMSLSAPAMDADTPTSRPD